MILTPGGRLGPYEIVGKLGEGGMGAVYRAHDARLARDVALKVLHPDLANDPVRLERFTREARAVAALSHPHIVTIYSTEEADGVRFLTMELVEGRTLDATIPPGGYAVPAALEIAVSLADALAAAHQKQILHRDLKPANVMLSADGRVKVLDFGLARTAAADLSLRSLDETRVALTHDGTIVGTMPYMSPEQIEGGTLDSRSDLFSLGVMMYELIAGKRPFGGASSPALMSAILRDTPPPLDEIRREVPAALARLVARSLEKRPGDRPRDAREVHDELRAAQRAWQSGATVVADPGEAPAADEAPLWLAVQPFAVRGRDADAEALAAGLTEDVSAGLVLFPMLTVVAPGAAPHVRSAIDLGPATDRRGEARYVLSGSVRKSSSAVRVTATLVDTGSGSQLWSDTYDRPAANADLFAIQDDVTDRIVATVADQAGVLARSMMQSVRQIPLDQLSRRELLLRADQFHVRPDARLHAELRSAIERRLRDRPDDPHLLASVAELYLAEHALMLNPLPDPLARVLRAGRRAVEVDPGCQAGWQALMRGCFFGFDRDGMHDAADRAIRLNPRNADALAWTGNLHTHAGEYDDGCELASRAMALNAAHPGWYHLAAFNRGFAGGDYAGALAAAQRVNIRESAWMHLAIAAAAGQLQRLDEGRQAVVALEALLPPLADEATLRDFVGRWYWDGEVADALLDGIRMSKSWTAGIGGTAGTSTIGRRPASGHLTAARTTAADLRIAVARFSVPSGDPAALLLAEGLRDDLTTNLSRFPYVRVIALADSGEHQAAAPAPRGAAGRLQARFLLEGSVRQSGGTVRVNARLSDAVSGVQLWASSFEEPSADRAASADRLANRITAQVADPFGALVRTMAAALVDVPWEQMSVADLVIQFYSHLERFEPEQHAKLRAAFERALEREPHDATGWACLAHLYSQEHDLEFNRQPNSLARHRQTAEHAIAIDAMSQTGWMSLASALFFAGDLDGSEHAAARAIALNPLNTHVLTYLGTGLSQTPGGERGVAMIRQALSLNPHLPGQVHVPLALDYYRMGDYTQALREARLVNIRHLPLPYMIAAAAAARLGQAEAARSALEEVARLRPEAIAAPRARSTWPPFLKSAPLVEALGEGLEQAVRIATSSAS